MELRSCALLCAFWGALGGDGDCVRREHVLTLETEGLDVQDPPPGALRRPGWRRERRGVARHLGNPGAAHPAGRPAPSRRRRGLSQPRRHPHRDRPRRCSDASWRQGPGGRLAGPISPSPTTRWALTSSVATSMPLASGPGVELGTWPSAEALVDQLGAALARAAEAEVEPQRRSRLRAAAEGLAGFGRRRGRGRGGGPARPAVMDTRAAEHRTPARQRLDKARRRTTVGHGCGGLSHQRVQQLLAS